MMMLMSVQINVQNCIFFTFSWSEVMSFLEKGNKNVPSSNIDVGSKTKLASADLTIEDTTASAASNQLVTKTESDSSQQPVRSTAKIVVKVGIAVMYTYQLSL